MNTSSSICPCCSGIEIEAIYSVDNIPVHDCILLNTPEEAINYPRRDLQLGFCKNCGFIFNMLFEASVQEYSETFEESQHFSATFDKFADDLIAMINQKCDLAGKHILEIGCGRGEFLQRICNHANCTGTGIDPGFRPERIQDIMGNNVNFIEDFFGSDNFELDADIIICRHTLEHISTTASFIHDIRAMIDVRDDVTVFFETPDTKRILQEGAFWDIYYEHCSYFTTGSHARLFRRERFDVTELKLVYNKQYIVQFSRPASRTSEQRLPLENDLDLIRELVARFPEVVRSKISSWQQRIDSAIKQNKRIALWGGGSKAVSFLTTLGVGEYIDRVIDINPYKQGKYLPGTRHVINTPASLLDSPPDLIIVMNPIYLREISAYLESHQLMTELTALQ